MKSMGIGLPSAGHLRLQRVNEPSPSLHYHAPLSPRAFPGLDEDQILEGIRQPTFLTHSNIPTYDTGNRSLAGRLDQCP